MWVQLVVSGVDYAGVTVCTYTCALPAPEHLRLRISLTLCIVRWRVWAVQLAGRGAVCMRACTLARITSARFLL